MQIKKTWYKTGPEVGYGRYSFVLLTKAACTEVSAMRLYHLLSVVLSIAALGLVFMILNIGPFCHPQQLDHVKRVMAAHVPSNCTTLEIDVYILQSVSNPNKKANMTKPPVRVILGLIVALDLERGSTARTAAPGRCTVCCPLAVCLGIWRRDQRYR